MSTDVAKVMPLIRKMISICDDAETAAIGMPFNEIWQL